jgi:hypothetical protein
MKNIQKNPEQIEKWVPFWMIVVSGQRGPRKKYHKLMDAMRDADALCTINSQKAFILQPIGIIFPPGSGDLPEGERMDSGEVGRQRAAAEDPVPQSGVVETALKIKKEKKAKKLKKVVDKP